MRRLLVLRPEPGATATVRKARELGLDAFAIPLFEVEPVAWQAPEPRGFDGLLLTSANAVRHGGDQLRSLTGLPVYAVGGATADAAREAGFPVAAVGESGIDALLGSIDAGLRLLHPCGEDRMTPTETRQRVTSLTVYRAKQCDDVDLGGVRGTVALVHSPRAARCLAELVEDRGSIAVAAISAATAEAVGSGWQRVEVADRPADEALLALAARLCNIPAAQ
jgi:uroporphyrinogen-III synthase